MIDIIARELLLVAVALLADQSTPVIVAVTCTTNSPVTATCPRTVADELAYEDLIELLSTPPYGVRND